MLHLAVHADVFLDQPVHELRVGQLQARHTAGSQRDKADMRTSGEHETGMAVVRRKFRP